MNDPAVTSIPTVTSTEAIGLLGAEHTGRPPSVVLTAPAKLTLTLRITGLLDRGMHALDAEMVTLDFYDRLTVTPLPPGAPAEASEVRFEGTDDVIDPENNLVTQALALAGRPARVSVAKAIPAGAGLGGGSADAAAILRWAGYTDHAEAAFRLGADVAFCLRGGRAHVTGFGEKLEHLPFKDLVVTLVTPPVRCATGDVFKAWDRLGGPQGPGVNDLELAALDVAPELVRWRDELGESTGQQPHLAGSGSTWFVYGAFPGPGRVVARTVPAST